MTHDKATERELAEALVELARWSEVATRNGELHARIASALALAELGAGSSAAVVDGAEQVFGHHETVGERQGGQPVPDKATEGRTGAAAVDQAIADVEKALAHLREWNLEAAWDGKKALAALRVLADAVEELREKNARERKARKAVEGVRAEEVVVARTNLAARAEAAEAENVRLARQAADLKAALILYGRHGTFCAHSTGGMCDCGLATALSRDSQKEVSEETTNT